MLENKRDGVLGVLENEDREGRASVEALRHVGEKFPKECEEGIALEILSHDLVASEGRESHSHGPVTRLAVP